MKPVKKQFRFSRRETSPDIQVRNAREFSEMATLRPSPFSLQCVPLMVFRLRPLSAAEKLVQQQKEQREIIAYFQTHGINGAGPEDAL